MDRRLPPSARRVALARKAGLVLESPAWTAAVALAAAVAATAAALVTGARLLLSLARTTLATAAEPGAAARARAFDVSGVLVDLGAIVAPIVIAAAVGGLVAGAALARGLFVPRRDVRGAPAAPAGLGGAATDAVLAVVRAAILLAVGASFVLGHLVGLTRLAAAAPTAIAHAAGAFAIAALAHLAAAAVALAALDVVVRHRRLATALRMTDREARDERRESAGDPGMRQRQRRAHGPDPRDRVALATMVLVGARSAAAIRWRTGVLAPDVVATAAGLAAHALVAAARHRGVPIFADEDLAALPAGPVAAAHQPRVVAVLAALGLAPPVTARAA